MSLAYRLKSERGASLSMALMLFLFCTVMSALAITAASAAVGRRSELKETDTSYYNVTSAAGLFWDALQDESPITVTIERTYDEDEDEWSCTLKDQASRTDMTLFEMLACQAVFGGAVELPDPGDEDAHFMEGSGDAATPKSVDVGEITQTLTVKGPGTDPVTVTVQGDSNDIVQFTFTEGESTGDDSSFECTIVARVSPSSRQISGGYETIVTFEPGYITVGGAV